MLWKEGTERASLSIVEIPCDCHSWVYWWLNRLNHLTFCSLQLQKNSRQTTCAKFAWMHRLNVSFWNAVTVARVWAVERWEKYLRFNCAKSKLKTILKSNLDFIFIPRSSASAPSADPTSFESSEFSSHKQTIKFQFKFLFNFNRREEIYFCISKLWSYLRVWKNY